MIFGRKREQKDPILGLDVGSESTCLVGLSPSGTDQLVVEAPDGTGPVIPTVAASLDGDSAVGHHAADLLNAGAPAFELVSPFRYGREGWEENVVPLDEDPQDPLRRRYFEYLYRLARESVDEWEGRIAVPVRPARPAAGQDLLEEYLADAGFEVERRLDSPVAAAMGYWEYDSTLDPHFDLDRRDGGVALVVDMGARYIDAAVISIRMHTYRLLSTERGARDRSLIESYAAYKAEQRGLDISPTAETAPQRFGLLNPVRRHFPELVSDDRTSVTLTVPEEFGADEGTQVTLSASEVQQFVSLQMDSYGETIDRAITEAGLDSLNDVDLVITGGLPSRWLPVLRWWVERGAAWGSMADPSDTVDPDATVRIASGISGKFLAAQGASALAHSEVGHARHDIEVVT